VVGGTTPDAMITRRFEWRSWRTMRRMLDNRHGRRVRVLTTIATTPA
jgi:hypothetical protein